MSARSPVRSPFPFLVSLVLAGLAFEAAAARGVVVPDWSAPLPLGTSGLCVYHAAADVDLDGRPDLLVPTRHSNTIHVFLNAGGGAFGPDAPFESTSEVIAVDVADLDRDGNPDVLAMGFGSERLRVHRGNGTGAFPTSVDYPLPGKGHGITTRDLDGDGWTDVACTVAEAPDLLLVYWNDGAGGLVAGPTLPGLQRSFFVSAGDLNGDGFDDLVLTNFDSGSLSLFANDGNRGFQPAGTLVSGGTRPGRVAIADLDGDGVLDLAVPHFASTGLVWHRGDGAFGFASAGTVAASPGDSAGYWASAGDVNLDGRADVVFGLGSTGRMSVTLQSPLGGLSPAQHPLAGTTLVSFALADFDQNGSLDVSTSAYSDQAILVLTNSIADCNANQAPDADDVGSGASSDCDGDAVPDECPIAADSTLDLNSNGILDACECHVERYCIASPNSVGPGALLDHAGTVSVSRNDLVLLCTGCPPNTAGLFYFGALRSQVPFGNGYRCVAGPVTRTGIVVSSTSGAAARALDIVNLPGGTVIGAGSVRQFQFWYRNPAGGGAGFNLSDALEVQFCP